MAPPSLPLPYRLSLLYIEPLVALSGAIIALTNPSYLVRVIAPAASPHYHPGLHLTMLFEQLAGSWLTLAFVLAVLGRAAPDWPAFRLVVAAALVSDAANCASIVHTLGWATLLRPAGWRADDWTNVVSSFPPLLLKVALLLDVGIDRPGGRGGGRKKE